MKPTWKRYRSARAVMTAYFSGMVPGSTPEDFGEYGGGVSGADALEAVKRQGYWAFCDAKDRANPVVHYWHDGKRSVDQLAFLLGHELGHSTGKPYEGRSLKSTAAEEYRADDYGEVAKLVLQRLRKDGLL